MFFIFGLLFIFKINAQSGPNEVTAFNKAIAAYNNEQYEQALEYYREIPFYDSLYTTAQYESILCLYQLKRFDEAKTLCEKAIREPKPFPQYYNLYGTILDEEDKDWDAIKVYDRGIKKYPFNASLYLNQAVVFTDMKEYSKAVDVLQEIHKFNDVYSSTHLKLGKLATIEGLRTQAILALSLCVMLEPSSERSLSILSYLDNLSGDNMSGIGESEKKVIPKEFEDIDVLVKNQFALNKKYKVPGKFTFSFARQLYLIMQQLEEQKGSFDGYWGTYYAPIFTKIYEEDKYEEMILLMMASSTNEKVQKKVKSKLNQIRDFRIWFLNEWKEMHKSYTYRYNEKDYTLEKFYYDNGSLQGLGKLKDGDAYGDLFMFSENGCLSLVAKFDDNAQNEGTWVYFDDAGDTSKVISFKGGKEDGWETIYDDNNIRRRKVMYDNGTVNGDVIFYNERGHISSRDTYVDGVRQGESIEYYGIGTKSSEGNYKEGKIDGKVVVYYPDGIIKKEYTAKENELSGVAKDYYNDGVLSLEAEYVEGRLNGYYKSYHRNGKLKSEGQTRNDNMIGDWKVYGYDGKLTKTYTLDENGKFSGEVKYYDRNEKMYCIEDYQKETLKSISYYDEAGKMIKEAKSSGRELESDFFGYRREKVSHGTYVKGERDGKWEFYDSWGALDEVENYKDGMLDGENISYFRNGVAYIKGNYKDDQQDGSYVKQTRFKEKISEGNFKEGKPIGKWEYFHPNGEIEEVRYFNYDGNMCGINLFYTPEGVVSARYENDKNGLLRKYVTYDTLGNPVDSTVYDKHGDAQVAMKSKEGKVIYTATQKDGVLHGNSTWYYFNGKVSTEITFFNDERHDVAKWYYINDKMSTIGEYLHGDKIGLWKDYDFTGEISSEETFEYGLQHGMTRYYYFNGGLSFEANYYQDERDGKVIDYSRSGDVEMIRYYDRGKWIGYSYLDKSGNEVKMIPVNNDKFTVKTYFKNGNQAYEFTVIKGYYQGEFICYHPNGKVSRKKQYKDGDVLGKDVSYYESGKKAIETNYDDKGNRQGYKIWYYPNGIKAREIPYKYGYKHGWEIFYNKSGKVVHKILHHYGNEVTAQ